jgi:hypothetical protein
MGQVQKSKSLNALAVTAFVLSLLLFNAVAAILGHLALSKIAKSGQAGRGLAIAALVNGWLQTIVLIWFVLNPYSLGVVVGTIWNILGIG